MGILIGPCYRSTAPRLAPAPVARTALPPSGPARDHEAKSSNPGSEKGMGFGPGGFHSRGWAVESRLRAVRTERVRVVGPVLSQPLQNLIRRVPRLPEGWSYSWQSPPPNPLSGPPSPVGPVGVPGPPGSARPEGQCRGHHGAQALGIGSGLGCSPNCLPSQAEKAGPAALRLSGPGAWGGGQLNPGEPRSPLRRQRRCRRRSAPGGCPSPAKWSLPRRPPRIPGLCAAPENPSRRSLLLWSQG